MNPFAVFAFPRARRLPLLLAGLISTLGGAAWAQTPPLPTSPQPVEEKAAPAPRVFDVAPSVAFATLDGKTWNSRDFLGNRAVLVLLLPGKTPDTFLSALSATAEKLRAAGVEPVVLLTSQTAEAVQKRVSPAMLQTLSVGRDLEAVRSKFGVQSNEATMLYIDKAGFWRRTDVFSSVENFQAALEQSSGWSPRIEVGQAAPEFSMALSDGHAFHLRDLRGQKNLLLTFFPKCFTGGCTNHLTSLRDQQLQFDGAQTQVIAVSVDPADGPRGQVAFAQRWSLGFPLVPDVGRNLCLLYGAATSPNQLAARMSVLIDKEGVVRWISRTVDVHTHGADVVAVLKEQRMMK